MGSSKQERILIAASIYPPDPGGPAIHAKMQYEWFPKNGYETGLVSLASFRQWPRGLRHLLFFWKLLALANKYDVIYAHDAVGAGIPAMVVARLFGKKLFVRIGGDLAWERDAEKNKTELSLNEWYKKGLNGSNYLLYLSKFLLTRAYKIVVTSKLLFDLYVDVYKIDRQKIITISNPIEPVPVLNTTKEKTIIFASRLVKYKNLAFVLRALDKVFQKDSELKFIIIGDGPEKNKLKEQAFELGVSDRIVFTGKISHLEVIKHTASCLFTLAPALTEFNPNYVMEGIAYHKPFLISKENGMPFKVPEELIFDPRNEFDLEQKIRFLLEEESYNTVVDKIKDIDFSYEQTWMDVIKKNIEIIKG